MSESKSKIRIMRIIDILKEETDKEHPISTVELISRLKDMGISSDRKTIYNDIEVINDNYLEINTLKKSQNQYFVEDREFDYSEIQIIASAVMAAGFISEGQTKDLVDRLYNLTSKGRREILKQSITLKNPQKHTNNEIFINIETIIEAIRLRKKVVFDYFHYTLSGDKNTKSDVKISPVDLIYSNDFYYFIGYAGENKYYTFRIDKIKNMDILSEEMEKNTYNSKKYIDENFSAKTFSMFDGEEVYVELLISKAIVDPIVDRYGENLIITQIDDNWGKITVPAKVERTFFSWITQFGPNMKLIGPENVVYDFKKYLSDILKVYEV